MNKKQEMKELINHAVDCMGVAVTIIDPEGILLYYNNHAAKFLDRKPEYLGSKVFNYHKKTNVNDKIKSIIHDFQNGRISPFKYEAKPYGKPVFVTVSPILSDGKFIGCIQSVIPNEDIEP